MSSRILLLSRVACWPSPMIRVPCCIRKCSAYWRDEPGFRPLGHPRITCRVVPTDRRCTYTPLVYNNLVVIQTFQQRRRAGLLPLLFSDMPPKRPSFTAAVVSADQFDTSVVAVENGSVNVSDGDPFKMVDCHPPVSAIDVLSLLNSSRRLWRYRSSLKQPHKIQIKGMNLASFRCILSRPYCFAPLRMFRLHSALRRTAALIARHICDASATFNRLQSLP